MVKKKKKKKTSRTNGSNTTKSTSGKRRMISLELVNLQMVALLLSLFLIGKINTTFHPLKKRPISCIKTEDNINRRPATIR